MSGPSPMDEWEEVNIYQKWVRHYFEMDRDRFIAFVAGLLGVTADGPVGTYTISPGPIDRISWIKQHRALYGSALKEAKDVCDAVYPREHFPHLGGACVPHIVERWP